MDAASTLVSVENNDEWLTLARTHLTDPRAQFVLADGLEFLERTAAESFDFIYADTWPGKFTGFDHTLRILRPHGLVVMDDLLPQPNWPADHAPKVARLLEEIDRLPREKYAVLKMGWYTGHIVVAKRGR
jgi:predicted O-methyltransferase YrrM